MLPVSILIPLTGNFIASQICFEDAIKNCGIQDFELLIFNNGSDDKNVKEWGKSLAYRYPGSQYFESESIQRNSYVLNKLLGVAKNEFICILPSPIYLPENWLLEMVCSNSSIIDSGITAITDSYKKGYITPLLNEQEKFEYVYQPEGNIVNGVFLFHWNILKIIGGFDLRLNQGYEYDQFCYRVSTHGLINYYLGNKSATSCAGIVPTCYFETTQKEYSENIRDMHKRKNFQVKISSATRDEKIAMKHVKDVMNKFRSITKKEFYLELSETFGFEIIGFSNDEVIHLERFCKNFNMKWIVLPSQTLPRGISIQFYENYDKK